MKTKISGGLGRAEVLAFSLLEGSILTLGGVVAPVLFRRIPSRDQAGRIFGRILKNWFWLGLGCLLTLAVSGLNSLFQSKRPASTLLLGRLLVVFNMLGILGFFRLVLAKMDTIRASLNGPIENYPPESGPRSEFNRLHRLSTRLMQSVMGLGFAWLILSVIFSRKVRKHELQ
ncbi:MAG TPA: DUF4149 domain-containing protein [Chloroflexia bacterium]|nr:DUF4149 domain-containing protein [Chloroflexia bacterium]